MTDDRPPDTRPLQSLVMFAVAIGVPIYLGVTVGWGVAAVAAIGIFVVSSVVGLLILALTIKLDTPWWVGESLGFSKLLALGYVALRVGMSYSPPWS